ncbi:MAG: endonuclease domain-containing protein [Bacteroidota bacterium]
MRDHVMAARLLRKRQTEAEKKLWEMLRDRRFLGRKVLRQHPIRIIIDKRRRFFLADFYCAEKETVIELDGAYHERQKDYDELRSAIINARGIRVVRIKNEDLDDLEWLTGKLMEWLE